MTKTFIDRIWEDKKEFDKFELYEYRINEEEILKRRDELSKVTYYIPIKLLKYVDDSYYDNVTQEAKEQLIKANKLFRYISEKDAVELVKKDLLAWVQEHKEWESIIIKQ